MIVHSVFFKLKHATATDAEQEFLARAAAVLPNIPGVEKFNVLEETSPKNPYTFGFSMEFNDQEAYDAYNTHPEHIRFVQETWLKEVDEFQEIDYVQYRK
jgi:quinol monooxygenase YgiN